MIHCQFFENRLYNFGTNKPDPSVDAEFLTQLQARCKNTSTEATASSPPRASPLFAPSSNPSYRPSMSLTSTTPMTPYGRTMSPSSFDASAPYHPRTLPSMEPSFSGSPSSLSDIKTEERADPRSDCLYASLLCNGNEPAVNMGYKAAGTDFGSVYAFYRGKASCIQISSS